MALIDEYMPTWDVRSRHAIAVDAPAEHTYAALRTADLAANPVVRGMLGLRALPAAIASGRMRDLRARATRRITLADFEQHGFRVLAEQPPRDLVLGLEGAFWRPGGGLRDVDPATFAGRVPRGFARATWSFVVEPLSARTSQLRTETRVLTGGRAARRRFRIYWSCIGWASGVIRSLMLQAIKAEAEKHSTGQATSP